MKKNIAILLLVLVCNLCQAQLISTLDSGLVAYYPFNGNAGDSSINGNSPVFNNATLTVDRFGNQNSAYKFDGSSSYMRIPNSPSLNMGKKISISAWVKINGFYKGVCHGNYVISKFNANTSTYFGYLLSFDDAPYYNYNQCTQVVDTLHQNFYGPGGPPSSLPYVQSGRWQQVVYTCDGKNVKLYIDSRLVSSVLDSSYTFANSGDLYFGKFDHPSYPYWFNGVLDDVRIYNRPLNDSEVTSLYTHAAPYPTITGQVFVDENLNGIFDVNDYPKPNVRIDLSNGKYTFSDINGNYSLYADSIGSYTVTAQPPNLFTASPTSSSYYFNSYKTVVHNDIALQPNIIKDSVYMSVTPLVMNPTPGGIYPYWITYENAGTTTLSPLASLTYGNYMLSYDSCSDVNAQPISNGIVTGQNNMLAGQQNNLVSFFTIKSSNNIGDTLKTNFNISDAATGAFYSDEFYSILEGSTSPNGQRATTTITPTQLANGKEIVYTIGFKNTTNSNILDVVIEDSLSSLLQANTVRIIASSHKCKATIKGNRVLFELMDINIPTATSNSVRSLGFVSFSVKPKTNLVAGTTIYNKAYTSYNNFAPIITNASTLIKPIVTPVKLNNFSASLLENKIVINWQTLSEINTSYFNVQRSTNGVEFFNIGTIVADGKGNYLMNDFDCKSSNVFYYRLQTVDKDGYKEFSKIVAIRTDIKQNIFVFPNPATTEINVSRNNNKPLQISIFNALGKVCRTVRLVKQQETIKINDLEMGTYFLVTENGERIRIVKL